MTINKFNYEAFALDYLEGNLSVELTEEMERFLRTYPAIEAELSGMMEVVYLAPDTTIAFENKDSLLKKEKVVWLNKKWIRPLMAAASVLLLLMTYLVGYQAGVQQVDNVVVVDKKETENGHNSSAVANIEKEEVIEVKGTLKLPVIDETKVEDRIVQKKIQPIEKTTIIDNVKKVIEQAPRENIVSITPTELIDESLQVIDNKLIKATKVSEIVVVNEPVVLTPLKNIVPTSIGQANTTNNLNGLTNALLVDVPVAELAGISYQKKKRGIRDFLGRFPVTQLKEALIPTYYKEENAGQ